MGIQKVALLTAGGLAPCLSSTIAALLRHYKTANQKVELYAYQHGYYGLLRGDLIKIPDYTDAQLALLDNFGGSPIGNSRVKLTNSADCAKRGLIEPGQDAVAVAADQLANQGIDILHTIGGDDTNTTAADLAAHLEAAGSHLTVVGLPKTIDNDIVPVRQSLGAWTAAEQGALFAQNVLCENTTNPRMLIIHEVMGRHSGWLTARTAYEYHNRQAAQTWWPQIGLSSQRWGIHGIMLPELHFNLDKLTTELKAVMDEIGCVNLFVAEGAGIDEIVEVIEAEGTEVKRDAFGHVKIDTINPGAWFGNRIGKAIGAEKVLVQKSGYFARSAKANTQDLALIDQMATLGVEQALAGVSGLIGQDTNKGDELRAIEFDRVKGGKAFDLNTDWFVDLTADLQLAKG